MGEKLNSKLSDIAQLLQDNGFVRALVDSLPYGLLVIDRQGRVQVVNDIFESVLEVSKQTVIGKGTGNALGCLHVSDHPNGCGFGEYCKDCEGKEVAVTAFATNRKQRAKAHFQLIIDGQVRDLTIALSAIPFTFNNESFIALIIEDLNALKVFPPTDTKEGFREIVGRDSKMKELFDTIRQVAPTDAPVMIQGESGTGKELVALAVHKESPRGEKHFVPVNCGALPEGLLESELFGHVKGAFTGAHRDKKGRFEVANDGTVFLDEVGEMSPVTQVKLLRVLQEGCFEQVGSELTMRVNVRVISATNKNLEEEVQAGRFRQDLYYRLCVMPITVPPLRDRKDDIPLLVRHFLAHFSEAVADKKVSLSSMALLILTAHGWPGNVRELQNTLQFALVKCQGQRIEPEHLPATLRINISTPDTVRHRETKLQAANVAEAMREAGGNKYKAAKILSVSRSTLYRFLEKLEDK